MRLQGQLAVHAGNQGCAVTQKEKQQIQHDAKADQKLKCVLPDAQRLGGQKLAGAAQSGAQALLNQGRVSQPETGQQAVHPLGQQAVKILQVAAEAGFFCLQIAEQQIHQ